MKSVSVYENKTLLAKYYNACVDYFKKVNDATYKAVVEAEHACRKAKISFGEINRTRFDAFNSVEHEHGSEAAVN